MLLLNISTINFLHNVVNCIKICAQDKKIRRTTKKPIPKKEIHNYLRLSIGNYLPIYPQVITS